MEKQIVVFETTVPKSFIRRLLMVLGIIKPKVSVKNKTKPGE